MKINWHGPLLAASLLASVAGCTAAQPAAQSPVPASSASGVTTNVTAAVTAGESAEATSTVRPIGWTDASHGDGVEPDYAVVFAQNKVNALTITIAPEDWEAMQSNMIDLFGQPGTGRQGGAPQNAASQGVQPPTARQPGARSAFPGGAFPGEGRQPGGGGMPGGGGGADMTPENPMWVPATIDFEGKSWTNVGVRYKGNSTLRQGWSGNSSKLGLKLDFDQYEDENPEIANQRFFGFKQLSLASNLGDSTYMRETVAYDLLEEAGLPAAETAFYEVFLDYGEGKVSLGLYTMVEVIDDTVVDRYFGEDDGNIYEADGPAASLAEGTSDRIETSFQKENNEDADDWSDLESLYAALHSAERTADPAAWRTKMESLFDVDAFLEWLAISTTIGHWDTYGAMNHNYYLYSDPDTGRLTWISWDHNYVLGAGGGGAGARGQAPANVPADAPANVRAGERAGGPGGRGSTSLNKKEVGANWPLIRYLLDDPTYYAKYVGYLQETVEGVFDVDKLEAKYRAMAEVLAPYAASEGGEQAYQAAVQSLIETTRARAQAVNDFLGTQNSGS